MKSLRLLGTNKFKPLFMLCLSICILFNSVTAKADTPYKTFTQDGYGRIVETQTAYTPITTITKVGDLAFKNASDMQITADEEIYISDTEGKRIIVSDINGNLLRVYGEGELKNPVGLFVTNEKNLYVADKDAQRIVVFNLNGDVIKEYTKPEHPLYGSEMAFKPQKLVVDSKGIMYVICEGNTNGIVQISPTDGGTFLGYFGTNMTSINFLDVFRRIILTDEQLAKLPKNLPPTPNNLAIDNKGLIYTITQGVSLSSLKKLNVAGVNLIEPDAYDDLPAAVSVGNYENIFVVSEQGYIYEYNKDGSLLFVFGGKDSGRLRIGLFDKAVAIDVDRSNNLYVLDQEKNEIQVFQTTEFTDLVHEALSLYQNGKYTDSKEPLSQITSMNSLFDYANMAMGQAYLQEENYKEALKYFRLAKEYQGYSDAFWEVRNIWLKDNLVKSAAILLGLVLIWKLLKYLQRKRKLFTPVLTTLRKLGKVPVINRINYTWYFMKHPIDGCYGVKREGKANFISANILLSGFIVIYLINKYATGFILKRIVDGRYEIVTDILYILGVFLLMTICAYLISAINDGESTFKQLYTGFIYALGPYFIIKPFVVMLSNVITYNEIFLVQFANFCLYAWIVILIFMAVKEINNYTFSETVKVILLTFFCALIAVLLLFILYVLISQVIDFIQAIYGEVVYRFDK
ncbi:MAG: pgl1 [Anaerocolumna sp.]|jgi:DNA-binding beta-propeller fold protein YncE|nr:pgl1 [Anaerocolumna sp.]